MSERTITVREFLKNIAKNGLAKTTGTLFVDKTGNALSSYPTHWRGDYKIVEACAMGQGLINSGTIHSDAYTDPIYGKVYATVYVINDDNPAWNMEEIAAEASRRLDGKGLLDKTMTLPTFDYSPFLGEWYQPKDI